MTKNDGFLKFILLFVVVLRLIKSLVLMSLKVCRSKMLKAVLLICAPVFEKIIVMHFQREKDVESGPVDLSSSHWILSKRIQSKIL